MIIRRRACTLALSLLAVTTPGALAAGIGKLDPTGSGCVRSGTHLTCDLWVEPATMVVPAGFRASIPGSATDSSTTLGRLAALGYNLPTWVYAAGASEPTGPFTGTGGPTIVASEGDAVTVNLHNTHLLVPLSLTFPQIVGVRHDGRAGSDRLGVAGATVTTYTFTASSPGTFLYQAGPTVAGKRAIAMGLSGALVVEGNTGAYDLPSGAFTDEAVVLLQELDPALNLSTTPWTFDLSHFQAHLWLPNNALSGRSGGSNTVSVSANAPTLVRYVNAGLQDHWVSLLGLPQLRIAQDAQPQVNLGHGVGNANSDQSLNVTVAALPAGTTEDTIIAIPGTTPDGSAFPLYDDGNDGGTYVATDAAAVRGPGVFQNLVVATGTGTGSIAACGITGSAPLATVTGLTPLTQTVGGASLADASIAGTAVVCGSGSPASAVEYFLDDMGAPGTGTPVTMTGGTFTTTISTATLLAIDSSTTPARRALPHRVWFRANNGSAWGELSSAEIVLDTVGPDVKRISTDPTISNGTTSVHVWVSGDETTTGNTVVTGFAWSIAGATDAACASTVGIPTINQAPEVDLQFDIPVACTSTLGEGNHLLSIVATDHYGNATAAGGMNDPNTYTVAIDTTPPALVRTAGLVRVPAGPDTPGSPYPGDTTAVAVQVLQRLPYDAQNPTGVFGGPFTNWNNGTLPWELNTHELGVRASASDPTTTGVRSGVAAMYGSFDPAFCSTADPAGVGARLDAQGGRFHEPAIGFQYIPLAQLAQYTKLSAASSTDATYPGVRVAYYVRVVDTAGNWSACPHTYDVALDASAGTQRDEMAADPLTGSLIVAIGGDFAVGSLQLPKITAGNRAVFASSPRHTTINVTLRLDAATRGEGNGVTGAEWFDGHDPGVGNGVQFSLVSGQWGAVTANLVSTVSTVRWTPGVHVIAARVRDRAGNWSALTTARFSVSPRAVFADGFESRLRRWAHRQGVAVTSAAALVGRLGLAVTTGHGDAYVEAPALSTDTYRASFVVDTNGSRVEGAVQDLLLGSSGRVRLFAIQRTTRGQLQYIRLVALDGTRTKVGGWTATGDDRHAVSVSWFAGSSGLAELRLDGQLVSRLAVLRADAARLTTVRLGALGGAGTGSIRYDAYVSTR